MKRGVALLLLALPALAGPGGKGEPWMAHGAPVQRVVGQCQGGARPSVGCRTCLHCAYCSPRRQSGVKSACCAVCEPAEERQRGGETGRPVALVGR